MTILPISEVRARLGQLTREIGSGGEPVFIQHRGKVMAVLISAAEFAFLQGCEDQADYSAAEKAAGESGRIPWNELKRELDVD